MPSDSDGPVIGIDLGGTNITAGLVDSDNRIIERTKIDTAADEGPEAVLERVADVIDELLKKSNYSRSEMVGVGLGVPGAVDANTGVVLEAVNLRWRDLHLTEHLATKTDLAVTVDNDVNVGTWGEYELGAARGCTGVLGIFVGTGIGGGLILNGSLHTGVFGTAGEIGHTIIQSGAPFGARTVERLASRTAIVNRLVALVEANEKSEIRELAGKKWPRIRSKVLKKALAADDTLTLRVLGDAAKVIGHAAASAVTLLSLDCVVIGGGLTEALDDRWVQWIRDNFLDAVFPDVCRQCKVVAAELEDDAGLIGAALLARRRLG